jgi:hypothetical protein
VLLYLTALSANIHRGDSGIFFPHSAHRIFLLFAASIAVSISASGCRFYCRFVGRNYSSYPAFGLSQQ